MKPIKVHWEIQRPTSNDIKQMWSELAYEILDGDFEFINLLRSNIGGRVYFKGFRLNENEVFDWFCSRGRLDEIDFETNFLLSDSVLKTFNSVEDDDFREAFQISKKPKLDWKSEFVIDGELAALLFHGGAYGSAYKEQPKVIKDKAQRFCADLFDEKYSNEYVRYYTSSSAWNTWFIDFIIDQTYLMICMETRTLWLLAFTDTD